MRESNYWFISLVAGACMIVLLGVHLMLMHLGTLMAFLGIPAQEPLSYAAVAGRAKSITWVISYVALLGLALYHGLYGLRSILMEMRSFQKSRASTWVLVIIGVAAFSFGSYVVIRAYTMGGV